MVYSDEDEKWLPMSVPSVAGADAVLFAVPDGPAATHTAVADETDNTDDEDTADDVTDDDEDAEDEEQDDDETTSSHTIHSTLVTSVKKQTATPTLTAGRGHSHAAAAKRMAPA